MSRLSSSYLPCAKEGEKCNFSGENKSVAYVNPDGSGPIYYRNSKDEILCNNSTFKDPQQSSEKKICYVANIPKDITFTKDNIPNGFHLCAFEGDVCRISGSNSPVDFLYGGGNIIDQYIYASLPPHTSISCSDSIFGEVKSPFPKACFIRLPNPSSNTDTASSHIAPTFTNSFLLPGPTPSSSFAPILTEPTLSPSGSNSFPHSVSTLPELTPPSTLIAVPPSGENPSCTIMSQVFHHRLTIAQIVDIIVGIFIVMAIIVFIIVLLKKPSWTK
ncbi:MAG: hypothetical protein QXW79_00175 [Thermoplasmata archaeon]